MKTMVYKIGATLAFLMIMLTTAQSQIYVNAAATGSNNGTSWTDAYTDLQTAIANATVGSQIWIAAGTYSPGANTTDYFDISTPGIQLYGGFAGTETMLSQRDFVANKTVLTGDVNGDDIENDFTTNRADNNLHVMWVSDTITNTTIIDGLYIEHGQTLGASGSGNDRRAGGILCYGSPIVRNCVFSQNYGYFASSLYPRGSGADNVVVENCTFKNNEGRSGGAMYLVAGGVVRNCTFDNNFALFGAGAYSAGNQTSFENCSFTNSGGIDTRGAGIYGSTALRITNCTFDNLSGIWGTSIYATDVTIVDSCSFSNSTAVNNGGGLLMAFDAVVTITNTTFTGNAAGNGGALYSQNDSVLVTVSNCTFDGNAASSGSGGAYFSLAGPLADFQNCAFNINTGDFGAAIAFSSNDGKGVKDRLTIAQCTFSDNIASNQGGAINISNVDSVFITSSRINDNFANGNGVGGGISVNSGDSLPVYVRLMNNTLANNLGSIGSNLAVWQDDLNGGNATVVLQNNVFYDALTTSYAVEAGTPNVFSTGGNLCNENSFDTIFVNTNDVSLTDPLFVDITNRIYLLTPLSPCIDAGVAANAPLVDLVGTAQVGAPDKGCYEYPFNVSTNNIDVLETGFEVFPNPAVSELNFTIENNWTGEVQMTLVNNNGQVLQNWVVNKVQDMHQDKIDVSKLASGNYVLFARFENQVIRKMVTKF